MSAVTDHGDDTQQEAAARAASGSSFYLAMRLLPRDQREAMFAVYAFCRAVDDVADEPGMTQPERLVALDDWRRDVDRLFGGPPPVRMANLVGPVARFGLRRADFQAVIDGMEMDVEPPGDAYDWASLDRYCDCVASAVGRLSVRIFGAPDAEGTELSHHLGRALQLTNVLRDLDEDATIGRLYLPREAIAAAGLQATGPEIIADPRIDAACRLVAARAREHFRRATAIMDLLPKRTVRPPRLMAAAYGSLLDRLEARGWAPPRTPVRPSRRRLAWALLRHGLL